MDRLLYSPTGSLLHPDARILGVDLRLLVPTVVTSLLVYLLSTFFVKDEEKPVLVSHPVPPQVQPGWQGDTLESTEVLSPGDTQGLQIRSFDPSTGFHLGTFEADTQDSIDHKLREATAVADQWSRSSWSTRRKLLRSIREWTLQDQDTIVRVACRDSGKTALDAFFGEILTTSSKAKFLIESAEKVLRPQSRPNGNILIAHKKSTVHWKPLGVILASVSWNYPFHNILGPILAAIASGNTIVVKPSENVAFSTMYYVQCLHRILKALDLPTTLVTLVLVHPPLAPYLTKHKLIKHVTFIGSENVGRKVMVDAALNLTPVLLELGGKDPAILLKSTKVKDIASVCMRAVFQSAGQNCIGIERFIVHESLVDDLLKIIVPRAERLRCGSWLEDTSKGRGGEASAIDGKDEPNGVDFGAMISNASFEKLQALIKDAVERGATLHTGGARFPHPKWTAGHYFQPTVISGVTSDMPIAQTELFAPVFLIMPFRETREAIEIANGTSMGLGSSIFGNDKREIDFVKARLQSGMVNVNDFAVSYLNQGLPFGGTKASGFGRFGGPEGLQGICSTQSIVEDRFFSLIRTSIPAPVDYPVQDRSYGFVAGLHHFAFAPAGDWKGRFAGLCRLIREALR